MNTKGKHIKTRWPSVWPPEGNWADPRISLMENPPTFGEHVRPFDLQISVEDFPVDFYEDPPSCLPAAKLFCHTPTRCLAAERRPVVPLKKFFWILYQHLEIMYPLPLHLKGEGGWYMISRFRNGFSIGIV